MVVTTEATLEALPVVILRLEAQDKTMVVTTTVAKVAKAEIWSKDPKGWQSPVKR